MDVEPSRKRADRSKNLVGFRIDGVRYAVRILRVREIINPLEIVPVPYAPEVVLGVSDHRGEVVPVLDMRRRLGLDASKRTHKTKWLIVQSKERAVCLVVDSVTDVFGAEPSGRREVPRWNESTSSRGIEAVYAHQGSLVFVIDVDQVVEPTATLDLAEIAHRANREHDDSTTIREQGRIE